MGDPDVSLMIFRQFRDPRVGRQDGKVAAIRGLYGQFAVRTAEPAAAQLIVQFWSATTRDAAAG